MELQDEKLDVVVTSYLKAVESGNAPDRQKLLAEHPDFAPGHGSLAEIYASDAFEDHEKERAERERFLRLCPGSVLQQRPGELPDPSPLVDQAERLLAGKDNPNRIARLRAQISKSIRSAAMRHIPGKGW